MGNIKKKQLKNILYSFIIILIFILIIFLFLFYKVNVYENNFVNNVFINNVDVSGKNISDSIFLLEDITNEKLLIKDDVSEMELYLNECVFVEIDSKEVEDIFKKTNTLKNKIFGINDTYYTVQKKIIIDEKKLKEKMNDFINNKDRTNGTNAFIEYNNGNFEIEKESYGTIINETLLMEYLIEYIKNNCFDDVDNNYVVNIKNLNLYEVPNITYSMLENKKDLFNSNLSFEFEIDFYGNIEKIDKTILYSWLVFDVDNLPKLDDNNHFIYDYDKIFKTINDYSQKYNTYGKEFNFLSHTGEYVMIESPNFGWSLKVDDTTNVVIEQLNNQTTNTLSGIFLHKGISDTQDDLTSYVEVDIDEQHLYYFKNGELVLDSDFVSGNYGKTDTNKGIHRLMYKTKNATLRGRNYASFVHYWMPFNSDGEGFHDATWRNKFGGEIYKGNGSHGCVNMPLDKAKELYNLIENDTLVIIY